jgi:thymidylate synthase (FAD)
MFSDMNATLIDVMGDDDRVADAARVSFNKTAEQYSFDQNRRLIKYLAKHNHWTPFAHVQVTMHCKAPIFVARQMGKHQVGLVWNEVSRRYVDDPPEFYVPSEIRLKADNVKQGSSNETLPQDSWLYPEMEYICYNASAIYDEMLKVGICAEQARMFLPQNMMTEWYWTGSLVAFSRIVRLRTDPHTQKECRDLAKMIQNQLDNYDPLTVSWYHLTTTEVA